MSKIMQTPEPFSQLNFDDFLETVAVIVEAAGRKSMGTALRLKAQELREEYATVEGRGEETAFLGGDNDPNDGQGTGETGGDGGGEPPDAGRRVLDVGLDQSGSLNPKRPAVVSGDVHAGVEVEPAPEEGNEKTKRTRRKGK